MTYRARYDKGDWKAICDACGREFKASLLRQRWDGFMVCQDDWEPRQPQDFVRGVADIQTPAWTRPETQDTYVLACTTRSSIAGYASAGCMIASNFVIPYPPPIIQIIPPDNIHTSIVNFAIPNAAISDQL